MDNLLVSVIIPTYNRPDFLSRAIESVLNQTYHPIEIIVVDDNNPESEGRQLTGQVMKQFESVDNVKYVKHAFNKNGSAARNTGTRESKGYYIAFLDDDDVFLPQKIEKQVECLNHLDDTYAFCYTDFIINYGNKIKTKSTEYREGNLFMDALCRNLNIAAGSNLLIRKYAYEDIGGFDESFLRNQDLELIVKLFSKYKIAYVNYLGLIVYDHCQSSCVDIDELTTQYKKRFSKFIEKLTPKENQIFENMMMLQCLRSDINHRRFKRALKRICQGNVPIYLVILYIIFLCKCKITCKTKTFTVIKK